MSPSRIFGPGRSPSRPTSRPARCAASRAIAISSMWDSRVPCEKLRRSTSAPTLITPARISGLRVAGPSVATIFVRRKVLLLIAALVLVLVVFEVEPAEKFLGLAPAAGGHTQGDVAAAEEVERPIGRDHRLDPSLVEMPA